MTQEPLSIVITGGGTAGHIIPGLAIAQKLRERTPEIKLTWIGVKGRSEEDLVPRHNLQLLTIPGKGLRRQVSGKAGWENLKALASNGAGIARSLRILRKIKPSLVLGTGGYVCFPVMLCARFLGIPTIVCEQNLSPGLTVRVVARFADRVALTYPQTATSLPKRTKTRVTGNPVAQELLVLDNQAARQALGLPAAQLILLVFGGSLGSTALNATIAEVVQHRQWLEQLSKTWFILHSTGQRKFAEVRNLASSERSYRPEPYIYENYKALAAADAIIARAGASTLAEITARGIPALLVPWRGAANDEQTRNARLLVNEGAAEMVAESDFNATSVMEFLQRLGSDAGLRTSMAERARSLGQGDAAAKVCDLIDEVIAERQRV